MLGQPVSMPIPEVVGFRLTGDETITIIGLEGDLNPGDIVPATIIRADGTSVEIRLLCRIDTVAEREYVEHGGVLHYVLRKFAAE